MLLMTVLSLVLMPGCATPAEKDIPGEGESRTSSTSLQPIFLEQAHETGLDFVHINGMTGQFYFVEMTGSGGALFDYDNDGDLDLYAVQGHLLDPNQSTPQPNAPSDRLYRNDLVETGNLHFTDITNEARLRATGYGMGVAAGDMDNDGFVDLYVTNWGPNQLWRNRGDGTFEDVTAASGTEDSRWSTSAAFADYDRDGWLDLYVTSYVNYTWNTHKPCYATAGNLDYCGPHSYQPSPDRLFRNRGDGTFEDVSARSHIASAYGGALGVIATDLNGDDWPDFYVANDGMANQLWINQQDGRFKDEALLGGAAFNELGESQGSMGVDAADYDSDGDEDLFMTHIDEETNTLYRNEGQGLFNDYTFESGIGMPSRGFTGFGTAWIDYDNDTWLDLLIANGAVRTVEGLERAEDPFPLHQTNQLFHNRGDRGFEEVTDTAGNVFALSEVSRGAAFGDVDNDGDMDVVVFNNNGPLRLLQNEVGNRHAWIGLRLIEQTGRRDAYGARVAVTLADGRILWRRVRADASYCSSNDPRVLFGLGQADAIRAIEVRWPDGTREQWSGSGFPLRQYHVLQQGTSQQTG